MASTVTEKAVVGRRILLTRYSDLDKPDSAKPGIITELIPTQGASVRIRLAGQRHTLRVRPDYRGLTYLDEVTEVPALPMGRFQPTPDQLEGERDGVPVCTISEDGDLVLLTTDRTKAVAAATAYFTGVGLYDLDYVNFGALKLRWQAGNPAMPAQPDGAHNALADARHNRAMHHFLLTHTEDPAA